MPKFCPTCQGVTICDFCEFFDFNGEVVGGTMCYVDKGYCRLHEKPTEPDCDCDDFVCFRVKDVGEAES